MVFAYPKYSAMGREEERKKEFLAIGPFFDVKPDECPCCHGRHIVRYGHVSSNGRGRYLCKDCHKTFCGSAGTLYYRGRIGQHGIISFAGSLVLNRTVRDSAKAAGVSKNTARRYRRILLLRLRKRRKKPVLSGPSVQIDETYRTLCGRVRGRKKLRGISCQKEAIAIGTDETGKAVLNDIGCGHPSRIELRKAWDGIIDKGSTVIHDRLHGYKGALDVSKEITLNSKIPEQEARLGPVNHLCSGVKWFLRKHNGIRKENLDAYLCLYEIIHNEGPAVKAFTGWLLKGLVTGSGKLINT